MCKARIGSAFTLIELLVSVTILVILAGLTLTGMAKGKAKGRNTTCINNLRQHGIALAQFLGDHHSYPLAYSDPTLGKTEENYIFWQKAILPKDLDSEAKGSVANCPSATKPREFPVNLGFTDYGYNAWGLNGPGKRPLLGVGGRGPIFVPGANGLQGDYSPPVNEGEVKSPADFLTIGDAFIGWDSVIEDGKILMGRTDSAKESYGSSKRAPTRHNHHGHMLHADGHVRAEVSASLYGQD